MRQSKPCVTSEDQPLIKAAHAVIPAGQYCCRPQRPTSTTPHDCTYCKRQLPQDVRVAAKQCLRKMLVFDHGQLEGVALKRRAGSLESPTRARGCTQAATVQGRQQRQILVPAALPYSLLSPTLKRAVQFVCTLLPMPSMTTAGGRRVTVT